MHTRDRNESGFFTPERSSPYISQKTMEDLYRHHHRSVLYLTLSMIKNKEDALDLTHDVFLKVFERLSTFRGDSNFSTWLYAVCRNSSMEFLRKKQRHQYEPIDNCAHFLEEATLSEEESWMDTRRKLLEAEFSTARETDQNILYQKYIMQLSIREIQKKMNLSESAVKMRLQRARKKIERKICHMAEAG